MKEKEVLNGYGVLFALYVAKESGKNPSEIIDLLIKQAMDGWTPMNDY